MGEEPPKWVPKDDELVAHLRKVSFVDAILGAAFDEGGEYIDYRQVSELRPDPTPIIKDLLDTLCLSEGLIQNRLGVEAVGRAKAWLEGR